MEVENARNGGFEEEKYSSIMSVPLNAEANNGSKVNNENVLDLKRLETQVGGHDSRKKKYSDSSLGVYDLGNGLILKALNKPPRGPRELSFYQKVFSPDCSDIDLLELQQFLPSYHGIEEQGNTKFIKLTNLTANFQKPCIADLKMGRITYDREASAEKILTEESKFPPLKKIGFQITGMMIQNLTEKRVFEKSYTRNLSEENFLYKGLGAFFSILKDRSKRLVIQGLMSRLQQLETWFLKQKKFSFIASSLLIVYEGMNGESLENLPSDPATAGVCKEQSNSDNPCPLSSNAVETFQTLKTKEQLQTHETRKRLHNNNFDELNGNTEDICLKRKLRKEDVASESGMCNSVDSNGESPLSSLMPRDKCEEVPEFSIHFIDFAHVFPASDIDENFLFGLQNLISYLQQLLQ